jgi:hypothetical protein
MLLPMWLQVLCVNCSPSAGEHWHTAWDQRFNTPGPAYDLLVGRTGYFMGPNSTCAALFWCSKLKDSKALLDMAYPL